MLALQITSTKNFMNQLLSGETFDIFLLEEAVISTANTYTIDGHINQDFFLPKERNLEALPYEFQPWKELKGICFNLIKGKHTPLYFKLVFHLMPEHVVKILNQGHSSFDPGMIRAMVLSIKYDGNKATLTTGTAYQTFIMDKEPEQLWDKALTSYLSSKEIAFELL